MQLLLDYTLPHKPSPKPIVLGDAAYYKPDLKTYEVVCNFTNNAYPYPKIFKADQAEYYTKKYNHYHMYTWVVSVDPFSYRKDDSGVYKIKFIDLLCNYIIKQHIIDQDYEILIIFQAAETKGLHAHFNILSLRPMNEDAVNALTNMFNTKIDYSIKYQDPTLNTNEQLQLLAKYERIKSTGAYINYLQSSYKGTFYTVGNTKEVVTMFCCFDKNIIFPTGTIAKKAKYISPSVTIQSDNNLVIFLMRKLHTGTADYNELLSDNNIQGYLHIPNLKSIWENCYQQFAASLTHEQNINQLLCKLIALPTHEICACATIDLLLKQGISPWEFGTSLMRWLFAVEKKNAFLLMGPHNTGKSKLARLIWNLFLLKQRIVNDGIFSFANAPGSGCLLWEETQIPPELADITKLVLEGEPSVSITIKNHPSRTLNKRVPILITNNHELGVFCKGEQANFDARCYKFVFKNEVHLKDLCSNGIHYCNRLDTYNNPLTASTSQTVPPYQEQPIEDSVEDCTKFHVLTEESILSFIGLALHHNCHLIYNTKEPLSTVCKDIKSLIANNICQSSLINYA